MHAAATSPAAPAQSATAEAGSAPSRLLRGRDPGLWLGLLLAAIASLPAVVAWAPQMTDYPSHLAGFKVMLAHGADPWLTKFFVFHWEWTGNLGAELLMVPLEPLFGLEQGGRLIVALIPFLTGCGIIAAEWAVRRRIGVGSMLAFCTIWSPSLLMGFLNYSLSLAFALFAFALWVRMEGSRWRAPVMVPIGFIVWLSHVSGWGLLGVMVFGYEWSQRRSWLDWRKVIAPWPLIFPLLPMLIGVGANSKVSYGRSVLDYKWSILYKALRSHFEWFDVTSLCLLLALMVAALFTRRFDGRFGWGALGILFLTLAMPRHIFGGDYADYRLSTAALLAGCLAIDWAVPRWGLALAASLFAVRISIVTVDWYEDAELSREMIVAMDYVPEGARVATAVAIPRQLWSFGPYEHLGSYAVVRRSAMENSNFALPIVHMLSMRDRSFRFADPTQRILYSPGQKIDLKKFKPARYADFLWYIGTHRPDSLPDGARVIYATENSFLARLAKPAEPR